MNPGTCSWLEPPVLYRWAMTAQPTTSPSILPYFIDWRNQSTGETDCLSDSKFVEALLLEFVMYLQLVHVPAKSDA